jgi:signal transduction histidine kinase
VKFWRARRRTPALSSLLQRSIVMSAALATLLFSTPLAVEVQGIYRSQAISDLARDAERLRTMLTDVTGSGDPPDSVSRLVIPEPAGAQLGVYTASGALIAGQGPAVGERIVTQVGQNGVEEDGVLGGSLLVVVPVPVENDSGYVVRAAKPYSAVRNRTYATWALMLGLAIAVLLVVAGLARARARRIARPLQQLALAANALGQGDFSVRAVRSHVAEVDQVSVNLERTARRIGGMLERERSFSSDASHQMRTPLTAVRVGLESALLTPGADLRSAAVDALESLDRLEQTVLDLLALARDTSGPTSSVDVGAVVSEAARHWASLLGDHGRAVELEIEAELPRAVVAAPALRTVLDVLLGNAYTHGGGAVTVRVINAEATVLVEVSDAGPGVSRDPVAIFQRRSPEATGTGIGLALARSLIEADGGRLELTRPRPATFAVVLPVSRSAGSPLQRSGAS